MTPAISAVLSSSTKRSTRARRRSPGSCPTARQAADASSRRTTSPSTSIDAADYVLWRKNLGTTNVLPNDPVGGPIGAAQYDLWRAQFGETAPMSSGAGAGADRSIADATEPITSNTNVVDAPQSSVSSPVVASNDGSANARDSGFAELSETSFSHTSPILAPARLEVISSATPTPTNADQLLLAAIMESHGKEAANNLPQLTADATNPQSNLSLATLDAAFGTLADDASRL